jgi:hypothetical protein
MIDKPLNPHYCKTDVRRRALIWWDKLTSNKKIEFISKQWGFDKYWEKNYDKIGDSDKIIFYQHYA